MSTNTSRELDRVNQMNVLASTFGVGASISRDDVIQTMTKHKLAVPYWFINSDEYRAGRGVYCIPTTLYDQKIDGNAVGIIASASTSSKALQTEEAFAQALQLLSTKPTKPSSTLVPEAHSEFVPTRVFDSILPVIRAGIFFPVYIVGLSGFGKTISVEQACAQLGRELIRINITPRTDEDDLIGGLRLIDGNTVFSDGPVLQAMRRGAVLLLDETDRGSNNLMCLQSVLEGKPLFIKKTGEIVVPAPGFNIVATANTKGRGSVDGRYSAATIIDDAWLERFPVTIVADPFTRHEVTKMFKAIVDKLFVEDGLRKECDTFCSHLVTWYETVLKTFNEGAITDYISARRLVHIIHAFVIYKRRLPAIEACVSRFDEINSKSIIDLYRKIDAHTPI